MEIKLKELMELTNIGREELEGLIRDRKIPVYNVDNEYRFNRAELKAWLLENNIRVTKKILDYDLGSTGVSLTTLISRGGVFPNVTGRTAFEVIKNAVEFIPLPFEISRDRLIFNLLEREEMMTTAVGKGIALPHPREPIVTDPANQSVSICYLQNPIDFKALDHEPVHTLFVILSASAPAHLDILSRISFLCHEDEFVHLLSRKAPEKEIFDHIIIREMEWSEHKGDSRADTH